MINLVVEFEVKKENVDFVKNELKTLVSETRKEEGCVRYDLFTVDGKENTFMFIEEWESDDHLKAHSNSNHIKNYGQKTTDMFVSKVINRVTNYL